MQPAPNQTRGRGFRTVIDGNVRSYAASAQSDQRAWLQNCHQWKFEVICNQHLIRLEGVASE